MTTDADRLAADGIPLRIGDRDLRVRFSMRSMKLLTERYGSITGFNAALGVLGDDDQPDPYGDLAFMVAAGLAHEGITEDDILDACAPQQYREMHAALIGAVNQSFPRPSGKAEQGDQDETSPGASTTTSPPSAMADATKSSGR